MEILHTADIHWSANPEKRELARKSLIRLVEASQGVDLVVIAGDLFDSGYRPATATATTIW